MNFQGTSAKKVSETGRKKNFWHKPQLFRVSQTKKQIFKKKLTKEVHTQIVHTNNFFKKGKITLIFDFAMTPSAATFVIYQMLFII